MSLTRTVARQTKIMGRKMHKTWIEHYFYCDQEGCKDPESYHDDPEYGDPYMFWDQDNRCTDSAMYRAKEAGFKFVKRGGVRKILCPTCFKNEKRNI